MPSKSSIKINVCGYPVHINIIKGITKEWAEYYARKEKERIFNDCINNPKKYLGDAL